MHFMSVTYGPIDHTTHESNISQCILRYKAVPYDTSSVKRLYVFGAPPRTEIHDWFHLALHGATGGPLPCVGYRKTAPVCVCVCVGAKLLQKPVAHCKQADRPSSTRYTVPLDLDRLRMTKPRNLETSKPPDLQYTNKHKHTVCSAHMCECE